MVNVGPFRETAIPCWAVGEKLAPSGTKLSSLSSKKIKFLTSRSDRIFLDKIKDGDLPFLFFYSKRGIIYKLFSDFLRMRTSFGKKGTENAGGIFYIFWQRSKLWRPDERSLAWTGIFR